MTDFTSEFEKLVKNLDLTNVDENFNRLFPDRDFIIDDKETINIDGVIDGLYLQCEKFEPLLKSAEISDDILEELDNQSIIELLRDVFKEEVKARPVSVLAKEFEKSLREKEAENRLSLISTRSSMSTRSSVYMTAREDNSDCESLDSDTLSEYNSCDEELASPSMVITLMNQPGFLRSYSREREEIEEQFLVDSEMVNYTEFRRRKDGVMEMKKEEDGKVGGEKEEEVKEDEKVEVVVVEHNEDEFREELEVQKNEEILNFASFRVRKEETDGLKNGKDENFDNKEVEPLLEDQKTVLTIEKHNENKFKNEVIVRMNNEDYNQATFRIREEKGDDTNIAEDEKFAGKEEDIIKEDPTIHPTIAIIEKHQKKEIEIQENDWEVRTGDEEDEKNSEKAKEEVTVVIKREEFEESIQKTVEDNPCELNENPDRKRKISQKAVEIAENIVTVKPIPVRSATVDSPQIVPLIRAPLMKKERPNRRSFERMSTEEHRTNFLKLLKKMELKQEEESYHSVYNNP